MWVVSQVAATALAERGACCCTELRREAGAEAFALISSSCVRFDVLCGGVAERLACVGELEQRAGGPQRPASARPVGTVIGDIDRLWVGREELLRERGNGGWLGRARRLCRLLDKDIITRYGKYSPKV
jgi:hypothetical protein